MAGIPEVYFETPGMFKNTATVPYFDERERFKNMKLQISMMHANEGQIRCIQQKLSPDRRPVSFSSILFFTFFSTRGAVIPFLTQWLSAGELKIANEIYFRYKYR